MRNFSSKMNQDLKYQGSDPQEQEFVKYMRYGTNTTTIQLTLIAALEEIIPDIGTRSTINLHFIGAAGAELTSVPAFEELLHILPSLVALQLSFVGLNTEARKLHTIHCCAMCTKMGRSISIAAWRDPYHAYIGSEFYKTPDLAAAFHSGFAVDEQTNWDPTIKYIAHAPHPTLFTAAKYFEIQEEMEIWKNLGTTFVRSAEVNKWKGRPHATVVSFVLPVPPGHRTIFRHVQ
jgi:splicing suppressor protein 51